jgi:hypothetical protein
MGDIIKLPVGDDAVFPLTCETCAEWDMLCAHFFVYSDGSFRCAQCGSSYTFVKGGARSNGTNGEEGEKA